MTLEGIAENIFAEAAIALVLAVLGWVIFVLTKRARLLKFFGVHKSRRIVIYLSNLTVPPGGTIGVDGQRRSYQGSAVARGEMEVALRFRDLFNHPFPSLFGKPSVLNKVLISDVQVQIVEPPHELGQVEDSVSFITLGSPAYNVASAFVEEELHSQTTFGSAPTTPPSPTGAPPGTVSVTTNAPPISGSVNRVVPPSGVPLSPDDIASVIEWLKVAHSPTISTVSLEEPGQPPAILVTDIPPIVDARYAFVERIVDRRHRRHVYYVAGLSELGTTGSAHFLATEWLRLDRKYARDTDFLIMLRVEPTDFQRWSIAFERQ